MAKLIKDIHDLIDYVADKGHSAIQRRADIDQALWEASNALFNEYLSKYELTSTIHEDLSDFELTEDFQNQTITDGEYPKPDDYERYTLLITSDGKKIQVVNNAMWADRNNDAVEGPTTDYPIARLGNAVIEIKPDTVELVLYYLKKPVKPFYSTDTQGNYDDASSIDVEWSSTHFHNLANRVVSKLGINLREDQIVQYSELMKQQEA